jgi:glycosyltransferase involved in cell wall biosynthesis
MHLRVQVPARNEAATIEAVARKALLSLDVLLGERRAGQASLLIIDDASTDGTRAIAERLSAEDPRVEVVSLPVSHGVGRVFREGVALAIDGGVDVLINLDGDGQFDAADLATVAGPVLAGEAELVTASRFLSIAPSPPMRLVRSLGNRALARLVSWLVGRRLSDACCGLRAFSRGALLTMRLREDFTYTQESLLECAWGGMRILERPVLVRGVRAYGRSRVSASVLRYGWLVAGILIRASMRRRRHPESPVTPGLGGGQVRL